MPPQEGVNYRESFLNALARGLHEECGITILDKAGRVSPQFYLRDVEYVDTLWLPSERWGERSVVGGAEENLFSHITVRKKAYWAAYLIVSETKTLKARPNVREVERVSWKSFNEAAVLVRAIRTEKADMLIRCLRKGMQHLAGTRAADEWSDRLDE
jgi:hypothetical protein